MTPTPDSTVVDQIIEIQAGLEIALPVKAIRPPVLHHDVHAQFVAAKGCGVEVEVVRIKLRQVRGFL